MTLQNLAKAPFPWFGGKSRAAELLWKLLGDPDHYVEPFAGALGALLNRPHPCNRPYFSETINDLDGLIVNAWRSIQLHPEAVAEHASWPVTEADKHARQIVCQKWRTDRNLDLLAGSPRWCDPEIGGWWLWAVCVQIGVIGGPWTSDPETGRIIKQARTGTREPGIKRSIVHLKGDGMGVNRPGTREPGIDRGRPHIGNNGRGVNRPGTREPGISRTIVHISSDGRGVIRPGTREPGVASRLDAITDPPEPEALEYHPLVMPELTRWMRHLSARLRHVRILNGDWSRAVTTGAAHTLSVRQGGVAAVFLDPPYSNAERYSGLYNEDDGDVAAACLRWCLSIDPANPKWRIVLAGYDTEHPELEANGWTVHEWFKKGHLTGGMGNLGQGEESHQQHRERLWASPQCLDPDAAKPQTLF